MFSFCFQVAQSQPLSGENVILEAPAVEVEALHVESLNSQGLLHEEVSWIVTRSISAHVLKLLSKLFEF